MARRMRDSFILAAILVGFGYLVCKDDSPKPPQYPDTETVRQ